MTEKEYIKDRVTAVIPVYNEECFLRQTLESAVNQVDCVIIGDNASTDGTEAICREFAEKYSHIKYFRQEKNLGSTRNIVCCYQLVETEYVFHIGGHDLIPPNYVAALKETLQANSDAICAYADVQIIDRDGKNLMREEFNNPDCKNIRAKMMAPYLVNPEPLVRAVQVVLRNNCNSMLWGIFRSREVVDEAVHISPALIVPDTVCMFLLLLRGKFIHCPHTEFISRDVHQFLATGPSGNYLERVTGQKGIKFDGKPVVDHIMAKFRETKIVASDPKLKKELYRKLTRYFLKAYGYSDDFLLDSCWSVKRVIFNLLLILYRFYPLKFCYRLLKSAIVPGYAEKWRKNELDKNESEPTSFQI
ncbi:MAG: glycosyltransferase [Planctomycetaceae bacterium]|jgi:glycosyltransferase involved in cell wall biosynthesis|nr:glycosyltransferase [Planctomycetaceae bacterium]